MGDLAYKLWVRYDSTRRLSLAQRLARGGWCARRSPVRDLLQPARHGVWGTYESALSRCLFSLWAQASEARENYEVYVRL